MSQGDPASEGAAESPKTMLSSLCPTAGGAASSSDRRCSQCFEAHPQTWGSTGDPSPAHPALPLLLPRGLSVHFRMLHMPPSAFWCILGAPVCIISGHTIPL